MANADGSIVVLVDMDDKQAQKELNRLNAKIKNLNEQIYSKQQKRIPLAEEAKRLSVELDNAKAKLDYMKSGKEFFPTASIDAQVKRVSEIQKEFVKASKSVEKIDGDIKTATVSLNRAKEQAGEVQEQLGTAAYNGNAMAEATKKASDYINRFSKRVKGLFRRILVFSLITTALRSMRDWMGKVIKANDEATIAIAQLKGALLTLAQPIVNVIVPAFVALSNVLTKVINAISSFVSFLFGSTIEQSAEAAENLYDETEALESVGSAAKKSEKALASFDEINKLVGKTESGGNGADAIIPDFSYLKNGLVSVLKFSLEDILFDWEDLTAEDIMAKLITVLSALAGAYIGFQLGGPGGAVLGLLIGSGIGLAISNLFFDGNGQLNQEEILKSVIFVLGTLAGGILGFVAGGPAGSAIGIILGAGISIAVSELFFNNDGVLNEEEILSSVVVALGALVGGILGFAVWGPLGTAIGVAVGAGIALDIASLIFNNDGTIGEDEVLNLLAIALGALTGGVLGFAVGGPGGAALGVIVGAGLTTTLLNLEFQDGGINAKNVIGGLVEFLIPLFAGLIGFSVGGPVGAVIGVTVGVGLSLLVDNAFFKSNGTGKKAGYDQGKELGQNAIDGAEDVLDINSPSGEMEKVGTNMMLGMENGVNNNAEKVRLAFEAVFTKIKDGGKNTANELKTSFEAFLTYLVGEFSGEWNKQWQEFKRVSSQNIQSVISDIDSLNARLAAIERNIAITITTVHRTVGESSSFGANGGASVNTVSTMSVPALATGAVIPPNREFLAVLGDQKSGTNIETPLSTMVQAFKQAMSEMGGGGDTTVILELDGQQFGKAIFKSYNQESRRVGVNLAGVRG